MVVGWDQHRLQQGEIGDVVRGKRCQGESLIVHRCSVFVIHPLPFMSSGVLGLRKVHKDTVPKMAREQPSRGTVCVNV